MKRPFRFGVVRRRIREYLQAKTLADAAMFDLAARGRVLPKRYWVEINRLLVPPVLAYCRQVGVTEHR